VGRAAARLTGPHRHSTVRSQRNSGVAAVANAGSSISMWASPGTITAFNFPGGPGVRLDTAVYSGYKVPPYYDSMIAKLIVHARTRDLAIARMRRALEVMVVEGIKTTIPLHQRIMEDANFQAGNFSTKFMEEFKYEV